MKIIKVEGRDGRSQQVLEHGRKQTKRLLCVCMHVSVNFDARYLPGLFFVLFWDKIFENVLSLSSS